MEGSIESPYLIYKKEGLIMFLTYRKITVDLDTARKIVAERLKIYGNNEYPTIVDIRKAKLFTKEARDYFAVDGVKGMKALAVITGSYLTVIITNLFIRFSRPKVPTMAFKTKEEAIQWLNQFIN